MGKTDLFVITHLTYSVSVTDGSAVRGTSLTKWQWQRTVPRSAKQSRIHRVYRTRKLVTSCIVQDPTTRKAKICPSFEGFLFEAEDFRRRGVECLALPPPFNSLKLLPFLLSEHLDLEVERQPDTLLSLAATLSPRVDPFRPHLLPRLPTSTFGHQQT